MSIFSIAKIIYCCIIIIINSYSLNNVFNFGKNIFKKLMQEKINLRKKNSIISLKCNIPIISRIIWYKNNNSCHILPSNSNRVLNLLIFSCHFNERPIKGFERREREISLRICCNFIFLSLLKLLTHLWILPLLFKLRAL